MEQPSLNYRYICKKCKTVFDFYRTSDYNISYTRNKNHNSGCNCTLNIAIARLQNTIDENLFEKVEKDLNLMDTLYDE